MAEPTRPAVIRIAPQTPPEPEIVHSDRADSVPTTAFPISEAVRRAEARLVREAMAKRPRRAS